ncbi:MAG: hypothetical protein MUF00_09490 [Gemmatimonadaceae bacterium]|jgi:hypothetical protein|nr:hypothetical protein [Gemmatimonadaceae bacterium]
MRDYVEAIDALGLVASALEMLQVPYFVTGALASGIHGEFRATNDVDIVAALTTTHVPAFHALLGARFLFDLPHAQAAVANAEMFNIVDLIYFLKIDLIPLRSAFDQAAAARAEVTTFAGSDVRARVATREDILLAKLRWYRLGGEQSDVQRRDIARLVEMNRGALDRAYLSRWAVTLGVSDLLARALGS